jgi:hypothetical protein
VTAGASTFQWKGDGTRAAAASTFRSRPTWVQEATATGKDDEAVAYRLEYEPFGGRLVAVTRQ